MIANTLPPHDLSGAGEQVVQLAAGLRARGHEVHILGRGRGQARGPKLLFPLTVVIPALRWIRRKRPDIVQLHESDGGLVAVAARALARWLPPGRLVALLQVSYLEEIRAVRPLVDRDRGVVVARPTTSELMFRWLRAPVQLTLGRWTARSSDHVFAPSRQTASELERDYGVTEVAVLPNVTAPGRPTPAPESRRGPLLFVGRFRIRKGIEILLHALESVGETDPPIQLQMVGDGERLQNIVETIQRLRLEPRVEVIGRKTPAEVVELLSRARALVVPSTYEGMPLVVLEAMSVGCPVIASRVSGIPEVVADGESGWLVEPEKVGALSAALAEAWQDPAECARRGERARIVHQERFLPERAAELWCERLDPDRRSAAGVDLEGKGEMS